MSTLESRERDRRLLEERVRSFLDKGGKIREIPTGASTDVIDYWGDTNNAEGDDDETRDELSKAGVGVRADRLR